MLKQLLALSKLGGQVPGSWKKILRKATGAAFKPVEQMAMEDFVVPGASVLDLGANAGDYTKTLADLVGCSGRVVAVEAQPEMARATAQRFAAIPNVLVVHAAIVSDPALDTVDFWLDSRPGSLGVASALEPDLTMGQWQKVEVPALTLDRLVHNHSIEPTFVKMDLEGAELEACRGGGVIKRFKPTWIFEAMKPDAAAYLQVQGYELLDFGRMRPFEPEDWHPGSGTFSEVLAIHQDVRPQSAYRNWPRLVPAGEVTPGGSIVLGPGRYISEVVVCSEEDALLELEVRRGSIPIPIWRCKALYSSEHFLRQQLFELSKRQNRIGWHLRVITPGATAVLHGVKVWRVGCG